MCENPFVLCVWIRLILCLATAGSSLYSVTYTLTLIVHLRMVCSLSPAAALKRGRVLLIALFLLLVLGLSFPSLLSVLPSVSVFVLAAGIIPRFCMLTQARPWGHVPRSVWIHTCRTKQGQTKCTIQHRQAKQHLLRTKHNHLDLGLNPCLYTVQMPLTISHYVVHQVLWNVFNSKLSAYIYIYEPFVWSGPSWVNSVFIFMRRFCQRKIKSPERSVWAHAGVYPLIRCQKCWTPLLLFDWMSFLFSKNISAHLCSTSTERLTELPCQRSLALLREVTPSRLREESVCAFSEKT